jgi:lipooligosaccharide transport system ATP-binding protein
MTVLHCRMLKVESLRKRYGELEVVRGVSFGVRPGECFGLLGPNGAGKTTTLRCCLGLTEADAGTIELAGLSVPSHAREARARVGVVPQFDNLDPDFSVAENLVVFGRYFGLSKRYCESRVPMLLEFAGLSDKGNAKIESLSGGMKRRLTLACALVNDPQVLFLDEPTTGLDPQARHLVWDRLKTLLNEGRTIILTTHFMDEAQRLCNRVAIMDNGALITENSPHALIEREIEPVVVEVYGDGLMEWYERSGKALSNRAELAGDTAFCYCQDAEPLLRSIEAGSGLRALRRAANLEDVFLKLTGRDLRD